MIWPLRWDFEKNIVALRTKGGPAEDAPTPWHLNLFRTFNEMEPRMLERTVLEDEKGVVYKSEKAAQVLWAFASFDFVLPPGAKVREVLTNKVSDGKTLKAEKHHTFIAWTLP